MGILANRRNKGFKFKTAFWKDKTLDEILIHGGQLRGG